MFFSLNSRTTEDLVAQERTRRRMMIWRRSFDERFAELEAEVKAMRDEVNRLTALVNGYSDDGK